MKWHGSVEYLWVCLGLWQVVVDLCGVWDCLQALPHSLQAFGDQVGRAFLAKPKHHGRSHIKSVALPVKMASTPTRDYIPSKKSSTLHAPQFLPALQADLK